MSIFIYRISRPDGEGKPSGISRLIGKYTEMSETWNERNALRTAMVEQAAHDKHLLLNAPRNKHVELKFPEYVSPFTPLCPETGYKKRKRKKELPMRDLWFGTGEMRGYWTEDGGKKMLI